VISPNAGRSDDDHLPGEFRAQAGRQSAGDEIAERDGVVSMRIFDIEIG
jgi:hypothetical protein